MSAAAVEPNAAGETQFLSFNDKISPGMVSYQAPSPAELEEMKQKDPPLRYTWVIWEQTVQSSDSKTAQYSDTTHQVASFKTVKGFWRFWNYLPQPSELLNGKKFVRESGESKSVVDALMIFREGVKPEWEDAVNAKGGHFQFLLKPNLGGGQIDEYWNNIILGIVGGTIEPEDIITGARLVDKLNAKASSIRLEIWFSGYDDNEKVDQLQKSLEKCMMTRLDGTSSAPNTWGKTEKKTHINK